MLLPKITAESKKNLLPREDTDKNSDIENKDLKTTIVKLYVAGKLTENQNETERNEKLTMPIANIDSQKKTTRQYCKCVTGCDKNYCISRKNKLECDFNCHEGKRCYNNTC